MNQTFFKYPVISVTVFLICCLIGIISITNPTFSSKYWSLTAYGFLFTGLIFVIGVFLFLLRLVRTDFENNSFYYGVGLFNFFTSGSLFIQWSHERVGVFGIILFPLMLGLYILADVYRVNKRAV